MVVFDFRHPEKSLYSELAHFEGLDGCEGWLNDETFVLKRAITIRKSDGVTYESLSDEEQEILDNDSTVMEDRVETVCFQRPPV